MTNAQTAVEVVDWRRRVFALYEAVRRAESRRRATKGSPPSSMNGIDA